MRHSPNLVHIPPSSPSELTPLCIHSHPTQPHTLGSGVVPFFASCSGHPLLDGLEQLTAVSINPQCPAPSSEWKFNAMGMRLSSWLALARSFQLVGAFAAVGMHGYLTIRVYTENLGLSEHMIALELLVCLLFTCRGPCHTRELT